MTWNKDGEAGVGDFSLRVYPIQIIKSTAWTYSIGIDWAQDRTSSVDCWTNKTQAMRAAELRLRTILSQAQEELERS